MTSFWTLGCVVVRCHAIFSSALAPFLLIPGREGEGPGDAENALSTSDLSMRACARNIRASSHLRSTYAATDYGPYVLLIAETLRDYVTSEYVFQCLRWAFYSAFETFSVAARIYRLTTSMWLLICHSRAPSASTTTECVPYASAAATTTTGIARVNATKTKMSDVATPWSIFFFIAPQYSVI